MQYAASARSPMIASLLPSPREKVLEVNTFRCHQMGLALRKGQVSDTPMFSRTLPMSPKRPKNKDLESEAPAFENTWALRSGRVRIIHDRQAQWTGSERESPTSPRKAATPAH